MTEQDMEDAIASDPKKYIGEEGLKLIARQYRIGEYIFDLLFQDRHGAKLIVEIQKGTLDRNHTYKIFDYYDEYKKNNPSEYIELMVIANKIPRERRDRLSSYGIEFREIPDKDFTINVTHDKEEKNENCLNSNNISAQDAKVKYEEVFYAENIVKTINGNIVSKYNLRCKYMPKLLQYKYWFQDYDSMKKCFMIFEIFRRKELIRIHGILQLDCIRNLQKTLGTNFEIKNSNLNDKDQFDSAVDIQCSNLDETHYKTLLSFIDNIILDTHASGIRDSER